MRAPASDLGDRRAVRYVHRVVRPYSAYYRATLNGGDPAQLAPTDLAQIMDPAELVLRPDLRSIVRNGDRQLAARTVVAKILGGMHRFERRVIEPDFKPVHWVVSSGVPLGYSVSDVQRLGGRGEQWLDLAGVTRADVVVSLLRPGPSVAQSQLVFACRRARVPAIHLDPSADASWVDGLAPTVIAGDPLAVLALLARARARGCQLRNLRLVLAVGEPLTAELRGRLRDLAHDAAVVGAWAPPGVRAVWSECFQSAGGGFHLAGDDVLETAPDGELWWTGLGWHGSAVLRLRTFVHGTITAGPCPSCDRPLRRMVPDGATGSRLGGRAHGNLLDGDDVAGWQIERRPGDERIVFVAPAWGTDPVDLALRIDRALAPTQIVILGRDELAARLQDAEGQSVTGSVS